jgi:hypoxanthine phosphoribosyltransferase
MDNPLEKKLLFSRETIQKRVKKLAALISSDYEGQEPVFIGVLNGAVFFFADLTRELDIPIKIDFVRAASYGSEMTSSCEIRLTKDVEIPVKGRPVILVEDIVDTGLTLAHIIKKMEAKAPESLKVCAFIDKLERRDVSVTVDYCGFRIEEGFVVGYGLDHDEKYRQLPDVFVLK